MSRKRVISLTVFYSLIISIFLFSCSRGYTPRKEESIIIDLTIDSFKESIALENSNISSTNESIWKAVADDGNKPKDIEVGFRSDSVILKSKEIYSLIDSIINNFSTNQDFLLNKKTADLLNSKIASVQDINNSIEVVNQHDEIYYSDKKKSSDWINRKEIDFEETNKFNPSIKYLSFLNLKYLIARNLQFASNEIAAEVGSTCCFCFDYILANYASDFNVVENDSIYNSRIFLTQHFKKPWLKFTFNGEELLNKGNGYLIQIPIKDSLKGRRNFDVIGKMKSKGREILITSSGYYFVR